jgi:hypothetical protein
MRPIHLPASTGPLGVGRGIYAAQIRFDRKTDCSVGPGALPGAFTEWLLMKSLNGVALIGLSCDRSSCPLEDRPAEVSPRI